MSPNPTDPTYADVIEQASRGLKAHFDEMERSGRLRPEDLQEARRSVLPNLKAWLEDPAVDRLSPRLKPALAEAVRAGRWDGLANAFLREVRFGTGGIRALMGFDKASIVALKECADLDAPILRGPNTINNIVVLKAAHGVGRFLAERPDRWSQKVPTAVVGFDSRTKGSHFARAVTEMLLADGLSVYLFDEAVPYPEVTFAIPHLHADVGIFISASHNDYRYNGFKMSGPNGAQISYKDRDIILKDYILKLSLADIAPVNLATAPPEVLARLTWLGGKSPLPGNEYFGREASLLDVHTAHIAQVRSFLLAPELLAPGSPAPLKVAYAAFNGAGRRAVPRILGELGVTDLHSIRRLDPLDGLFPAFRDTPGFEQQPDPGDPRSAAIAMKELKADGADWAASDLLIGTDPDADRCGVVVHPPRGQERLFAAQPSLRFSEDHFLMPADDLWALLVWYRLQHEIEKHGRVLDPHTKFVALSHTTSDTVPKLALKHGIGFLKTWVGFGWLSTGVSEAWRWAEGEVPRVANGRRSTGDPRCDLVFFDTTAMRATHKMNLATFEQSNGFSILGGPPAGYPATDRGLGAGGHVRDKDGTFAALLTAELAAYAKRRGTTLTGLLAKHIYADPAVGVFGNYYEPDPLDGEYAGIEGDAKKRAVVETALEVHRGVAAGGVSIGGRKVTASEVYYTGKYDRPDWTGFPDEGVRYYLGSDLDHVTVRPSGTTNSLRFHVQLHAGAVPEDRSWAKRLELEDQGRALVADLRKILGAPRREGEDY
jgi:phosphoglucomutase